MTLTFAAKIGRPSTDVIFTGGPELRFVFDPQRVERQNRIMPKEVADAISQNAGQDTHPHNRMEGLLGDNSYDSFVPFEVPLDELAGIYSVILGEPFKPLPNILPRQRTRCNESLARYWGTEEVVPVMIDENRRLELSSHRFVKFPERPGALLAGGMLGMNITESWWRPSAFPTGGEDEGWFPAYYPTITMAVRMQNTASAHEWGQRAEYFAHLPTQTLSLRGIKSAELPRIGTT